MPMQFYFDIPFPIENKVAPRCRPCANRIAKGTSKQESCALPLQERKQRNDAISTALLLT